MSSRPAISQKKSVFGAVDSDSEDEFDVGISAVLDGATSTTQRTYRAIPAHYSEDDNDEEYPPLISPDNSDAEDKAEGAGISDEGVGGTEDVFQETKGKVPVRKQVRPLRAQKSCFSLIFLRVRLSQ
jgi:hypothetical protein